MEFLNVEATAPAPMKFACKQCDRTFQSEISLSRHRPAHLKKKYECAICGMLFRTAYLQSRHNCPLIPMNNKCETCEKQCSSRKELWSHRRFHKKVKCERCGMDFQNKWDLRYHMRRNHRSDGEYQVEYLPMSLVNENVFVPPAITREQDSILNQELSPCFICGLGLYDEEVTLHLFYHVLGGMDDASTSASIPPQPLPFSIASILGDPSNSSAE